MDTKPLESEAEVVLVSNDTDLVPAFEDIQNEYPEVHRASILQ